MSPLRSQIPGTGPGPGPVPVPVPTPLDCLKVIVHYLKREEKEKILRLLFDGSPPLVKFKKFNFRCRTLISEKENMFSAVHLTDCRTLYRLSSPMTNSRALHYDHINLEFPQLHYQYLLKCLIQKNCCPYCNLQCFIKYSKIIVSHVLISHNGKQIRTVCI